jgi:hypothetical protein
MQWQGAAHYELPEKRISKSSSAHRVASALYKEMHFDLEMGLVGKFLFYR